MAGGVKAVQVELYRSVIAGVLQDDVGKEVVRTTTRVLNRAKVKCPVDTGNLRASHNFSLRRSASKITGEVGTRVKYALPVHEGRRAIVIRPKTKQALAFEWHGVPMVRKWVYQPMRAGKPWLRDALREVAAEEGYQMTSAATMDKNM